MKVVGNILLYFGATLFFILTPLLKVEKNEINIGYKYRT